jgi:hypothetical protein
VEVIGLDFYGGIVGTETDHDLLFRRNNTEGFRLGPGNHITASGDISASGDIIANYYNAKTSDTGYKLSGTKAMYTDNGTVFGRKANKTIITGSSIVLGQESTTHITASGNISASGTINGTLRGKSIDIVQAHFKHNIGTDLYYLPIAGVPDEQTNPHKEQNVMIAPCSGKLLRAIVRADLDLSGESCTMTLVVRPKNKLLNNSITTKEAITFTGPDATNNEDGNTVLVPFTSAASFVYGDALGVSVQFLDTGMTSSTDRLWVTLVFEYDYNTLGY